MGDLAVMRRDIEYGSQQPGLLGPFVNLSVPVSALPRLDGHRVTDGVPFQHERRVVPRHRGS